MSMLNIHVPVHGHAAHHRCVRVRVGVRVRVRVHVYKCRNAGLTGIRSVWYRNEKTNNAGTGPVPDQAKAVWHFLGPVLN
jgi:hypothetical protein